MRRILLSSALLLGTGLSAAGAALAASDGFYTVSYREISFELTQLGGYGELIVKPQGFQKMGYGDCTLNFTRTAEGMIDQRGPVVQSNAATCPETLDFTLSPGKDGLEQITFSEGGPLAGQTFELFPVLVPMREELRVTAPEGFDVLGITIGQTRAEIEAALTAKGYARIEAYEESAAYQGGYSKGQSLWGKGAYQHDASQPADMIAISWTAVIDGETPDERAEFIERSWRINPEDNLSVATLRKSLDDKHGRTTSGFESRFYDRTGVLQPKAFQFVCDPNLHLQQVSTSYNLIGESGELSLPISCGAQVKVMVGEDYSANGRASFLRLALLKGDVAYDSFYRTWSRGEERALQERYELQANMTGSAPDL